MSEPVLRCDGLVRTFGERVAVDHVSFEIAEGETYGLLGPNGAGKTTAISMIAGILRSDAGTVTVDGLPVGLGASAAKGHIGLVPQELALYEDLSALDNLRFFGRLQGLGGPELAQRIDEVLEVVALSDRRDDRVTEYSGGMKRRLNIAVGLLPQPRLLILDEPTVGVDPQSRHQVLDSIEVLGASGLSVLYTTHYMEEAERLCDRIGIIDQGRLVVEGTRRELIAGIGGDQRISLAATGDLARFATLAVGTEGVVSCTAVGDAVEIVVDDAAARLGDLIDLARREGLRTGSIDVREPDLESVFLHVTGAALRD